MAAVGWVVMFTQILQCCQIKIKIRNKNVIWNIVISNPIDTVEIIRRTVIRLFNNVLHLSILFSVVYCSQ